MLVAAPGLLADLGRAPFDDPGEGMHAEIARELAAGGDPRALTLNGVRYVDKPPLLYLLLAAGFSVAGPSEAAARAVPALAALVAVAATAWLGARLLGPAGGVVAGLGLLTSTGFFAYGRYVRPETLFVAALATGFALAIEGLRQHRRTLAMLGLAAFGMAALAKDPLGALAPPLALALAVSLAGRARPIGAWLPWPGLVAALTLGFGWWVLVESATPGFAWYTVVDNHILNVARARQFPDEDVPLSAPAFLAVALLGAAPWALAAGVTLWRMARRRAWRDPAEIGWTALALWTLGVLGLTALSPFRLPHYGLPAYPAIALLAARGWLQGAPRSLAASHAVLFAIIALAGGAAWASDGAAFVAGVFDMTDVATRKRAVAGAASALPSWSALRPLVGVTALVFGAGALALAVVSLARRRHPGGAAARPSRAPVFVVVAVMLATLPSVAAALALVASQRAVKPIADELTRRAGMDDIVAHEGPIENSGALEWYAGRRPVIVDGRRSVLGFGATRPESAAVFWDARQLGEAWESGSRVWLVTARAPERSVAAALPDARLVAAAGGRRLYVNR